MMALLISCAAALLPSPPLGALGSAPARADECSRASTVVMKRRGFYEPQELRKGDAWEGLISKVTDYGFFVRMGHEQHIGLVHIRGLASERLPKETVADWIEENVGPVGSKVQVEVEKLEFKGAKRTSLRLIDVISKQRMDDVVFAPGPRRQAGGFALDEE